MHHFYSIGAEWVSTIIYVQARELVNLPETSECILRMRLVRHPTPAPRIHSNKRQGTLTSGYAATAYIMRSSRQSRIDFV
ncbi:hypothetical protein [Zwartia hollandica]|jgi:hypothetical protein|uniref:hypothetical protein n=1 Tax=Zwartia hollandica TaxID=324606 RepID=UPI002180B34B|nr:hypothetical protein [Zwartia hollandica]